MVKYFGIEQNNFLKSKKYIRQKLFYKKIVMKITCFSDVFRNILIKCS